MVRFKSNLKFFQILLTCSYFSCLIPLKKIINERNLMVFWQYLVCNKAGSSHPATGQIIQNKTWLFIGSRLRHHFAGQAIESTRSRLSFINYTLFI